LQVVEVVAKRAAVVGEGIVVVVVEGVDRFEGLGYRTRQTVVVVLGPKPPRLQDPHELFSGVLERHHLQRGPSPPRLGRGYTGMGLD